MARQSATPQVAALEPDESLYGLFDMSTGSVETASECGSNDSAADVLMAMDHAVLLASIVKTEVTGMAIHHAFTRSTAPSLSPRSREKNFIAETWMPCILL